MAAEAVGFDLGKPLLVVNVAELISKWVGESGKNIETVFKDAKAKDAVLVFDEAESLFGSRGSGQSSSSRHGTMNVGLLLQYIENFSGVCIVITNMKDAIDEAFFRRFRFVVNFEMPDAELREKIWQSLVPKECPVDKGVSFHALAQRYDTMTGGDIKTAVLRAATRAALRPESQTLTLKDFELACDAEQEERQGQGNHRLMYS